jgi:hypothetical protein
MRRVFLLLLVLAAPLLVAACQSPIFHSRPPLYTRVVTERCTPIPYPYGP